jgi:hypothetical protein
VCHGTANRGEHHAWAKLNEMQVKEIRALKGTFCRRELAARFGISLRSVGMILNGKTWAWLK